MTTTPRIRNHNDFVAALTGATEALAAAHEYLVISSRCRNVFDSGHSDDHAAARVLRDASQLIAEAMKIAGETVDLTDRLD
ncbi:hypothetical protein [Mycobacteroides abscessus]|uniref:DUF3077 domain-containing protein n=1 Tax=Mycobacteroides abscessus subsp. bolletii CRM-0020 TaxID=1306401 RepID=A0A829HMA3_9MYCO|nr:hypothetical protein [Mycobacteroides abscessus]EPQ21014.1 hypothetical protein J108_23680 [Mycobacteroides abscessus subsp. bolletii CRM-0020]MBN7488292.1 hypothetical protein [Mycobacteroides abscessus subsp. abscessus]SKR75775.1 Uncharacterised protein [Mycobacteroides abscessus subsp. massiliense]